MWYRFWLWCLIALKCKIPGLIILNFQLFYAVNSTKAIMSLKQDSSSLLYEIKYALVSSRLVEGYEFALMPQVENLYQASLQKVVI